MPENVDLRSGLIVDVGANVGDWTEAVLRIVHGATVVAVEPAPDPARTLRSRFADVPNVSIIEAALTDHAGTAVLNLTSHSHNSSLKRPLDMDGSYGSGWSTTGQIEVRTETLDRVVDGRAVSLLKIDVQGAEASVLAGGSDALSRASAVLLEVTTRPHYEDDSTFALLDELMRSHGYRLAGVSPPFLGVEGEALWFDVCYRNLRR